MDETRFQDLKVSLAVCPTQNFQTISRHGQRSKHSLALMKPDAPTAWDNALDVEEKDLTFSY